MAVKNGFPDEALGDLYPFEDKSVELDDGTCLHYIETGRAGLRRPTILLLHGNPTWSFLYRQFMEPLASQARVIAVDHMGFGRSDHPPHVDDHSLERHIRNLEGFCQKLNLKRIVPVVHDWSGPIGLGYATRNPDRLAGLVIMNTWAFTERGAPKVPFWFRRMTHGRVGKFLVGRRNVFVEQVMPRLLVAPVTEEVMDAYRHPFPNLASRAALVAFPLMIPTDADHKEWATMDAIEKGLGSLDVPACILWGLKDPAFPKRYAHLFHEMLPQAEAPQWLEDGGHYLQEDVPGELVPRIQAFLRRL